MEIGHHRDAENARFSFLLGSALRNEDSDQFLEVYDSLLPHNLSEDKLTEVKEEARRIANLSDVEYNELVVKARHFSAAGCHCTSPPAPAYISPHSNMDDMPSQVHAAKVDLGRISQQHCGIIGDIEDGDSGVFNSSKATSGSYTSDMDLAEEDEGRGVWNYIHDGSSTANSMLPPKKRFTRAKASTKEEIEQQHDIAYDGAYDVDSDSDQHGSCNTVCSGGRIIKNTTKYDADLLEATEMKTFSLKETTHEDDEEDDYLRHVRDDYSYENLISRQQNTEMYDEAHSCHSESDDSDALQQVVVHRPGSSSGDESLSKVSVHRRLYNNDTDFTRMDDDDFSDPEELPVYEQRRFVSAPMRLSGIAPRKTPSEEDCIFRSRSSSHNYGTIHSSALQQDVHPSKNCFTGSTSYNLQNKRDFAIKPQPVFGSPPDLEKIGHSAERLLDSKGPTSKPVINMPKGARISQGNNTFSDTQEYAYSSSTLESGDKKKRSRRKKSQNDPGGGNDAKDENGNPVTPDAISPNFSTQTGSMGSEGKDHDVTTSANNKGSYEQKKLRKAKKERRNDVVKAKEIPGNRGDDNIDQLLSFINSDKSGRSGKTKNNATAALIVSADANALDADKTVSFHTTDKTSADASGSQQTTGKKKKKKALVSSSKPLSSDDTQPILNGLEGQSSRKISDCRDLPSVELNHINSTVERQDKHIIEESARSDYFIDDFLEPSKPEPSFNIVQRKKRTKRETEPVEERNTSNFENTSRRSRPQKSFSSRGVAPVEPAPVPISEKTNSSTSDLAVTQSSFPALHRQESSGQTDALQDDSSDLESVQSMASGHGSNGSQCPVPCSSSSASSVTHESSCPSLITPALPAQISYASIAAGTPKSRGSRGEDTTEKDVFTRERRHSFGSVTTLKDSEVVIGSPIVSRRGCDVSRSQEFPAISPVTHVSATKDTVSVNKSLTEFDSPSVDNSVVTDSKAAESVESEPIIEESTVVDKSERDLEEITEPLVKQSLQADTTISEASSSPSLSVSMPVSVAVPDNTTPSSPPVAEAAKPTKNSRKKPSSKPVIFFDTRYKNHESSYELNNHGLSFGIELDAIRNDNVTALFTDSLTSAPSDSSCINNEPSIGLTTEPSVAIDTSAEGGAGDSAISFFPAPSSDNPAHLSSSVPPCLSDGISDIKFSSHTPPNGLVRLAPNTTLSKQQEVKSSQVDQPETAASANKFLASIVSTGKQNQRRVPDYNFDPGNFDLAGAQVWLHASFEKVIAEKNKYPDKVCVYQG